MNRDAYTTQVFEEHLLTRSYTHLSEPTAKQRLSNTQQLLINNFESHRHELNQPVIEYFTKRFSDTPLYSNFLWYAKSPQNSNETSTSS
jgi:hypothetical protein